MPQPDTSLYPQPPAAAQPFNALDTIGKFQGIKNAMTQNQLMQAELPGTQAHAQSAQMDVQADQTFAKLLQDHSRPDGSIDALDLKSAVAKNPITAARFSKYMPIIDNYAAPVQGGVISEGPNKNSPRMVNLNQWQQEVGAASNPAQPNEPSAKSVVISSQDDQQSSPMYRQSVPATRAPGIAGGNPPGTEHVAESAVTHMDQMYGNLQGADQRIAALRQAKEALGHVSSTGPKTDYTNKIKSLLTSFGGPLAEKAAGVDPENINAYDELNKLLLQYSSTQPGASGSDLRTMNSMASNPSIHMQPGAIGTIINSLVGRELKTQAMAKDWSEAKKNGAAPTDFNDFMTPWTDRDPRAFNMEDRSPEEAHAMVNDIRTSGQADKFNDTLNIARKYGYSPPPKKKNNGQ